MNVHAELYTLVDATLHLSGWSHKAPHTPQRLTILSSSFQPKGKKTLIHYGMLVYGHLTRISLGAISVAPKLSLKTKKAREIGGTQEEH
jgi:hypothetical protein